MALADDINAVTAQLAQIATDFPPAMAKALADAAAAGTDPNLAPAVTNLQAQATATVAALQGALPVNPSTTG